MLAIDVVKNAHGFEVLHDDWNALACQGGTVFQSWEWAWRWWQSNSRGKKLLIVTARDGHKLVGLAPLCVTSSYCGLPVKVASFIATTGTDYLGFLLQPGSMGVAEELLDRILAEEIWDALDLHQLSAENSLLEVVSTKAPDGLFSFDRAEQDACYRLKLPGSYDELLNCLSKKFRWNVQYYGRRLARDHDITFRLCDSDTVDRDMDVFFALHRERFLSMKKPGAYLSPAFRKMHKNIAAEMCDAGWLRLYLMEIDNNPVAALYGFAFGDSFFYYLGGFDPEWGKMSVSTVLIAYAIEQAISEGLASFDFLRGDEPYKEKWTADKSQNYRVLIRRSGAKSHLVQKVLSFENELTRKAKDMVLNMR